MMERESITFDYANDVIIVTFVDQTTKTYTKDDANQYIADWPDRMSDIIAMGWVLKSAE